MAPTSIHPETPFIKINEDTIAISYKGQNHTVAIDNITNVYLKKSKMTYMPSFINSMMSFYEKKYKLYIRTHDSQEIKIKVKADEKQHFVNLVFYIRKAKAKLTMSVA